MRMMIAPYIPFIVAILLIAATLLDLRTGKIPNWIIYAFFALFMVQVAASPERSVFAWQLGFALGAFAIGLLLYAMLGVGAGAVKLLAAAALFLPMGYGWAMFGLLLVTLFSLGLVVTVVQVKFGREDSKWTVLKKRVMPLSLPVTATSLLGLFWLQA